MISPNLNQVLRNMADPAIAKHAQRFFKTGPGEYSEGDQFLGIRTPVLRKQSKVYQHIPLEDVLTVLRSPYHEERLCALFILVLKFSQGNDADRAKIYELFLDNRQHVNNWDLVDSSAYQIVGAYLENHDRGILNQLAQSDSLWDRRIAMISTFYFIKHHQFDDALAIATQLLHDHEDLIHKAVGWMLREIGKRDLAVETAFLKLHYQTMPRTMLRYAIEKFPKHERDLYLKGLI